jgi:hypothetical protein
MNFKEKCIEDITKALSEGRAAIINICGKDCYRFVKYGNTIKFHQDIEIGFDYEFNESELEKELRFILG